MKTKNCLGFVLLLWVLGPASAFGQAQFVTVKIWEDGKEFVTIRIRDDQEISSDNLGNYLVRATFQSTAQWIIKADAGDENRATLKGKFQVSVYKGGGPTPAFNELRLIRSKNERDTWFLAKDGIDLIEMAMCHARARKSYLKKDYDNAVSDLSQAIHFDAKNPTFYFERGLAQMGLGYYEKAIADYSETIRLDPKQFLAFYLRGQSFLAKGDQAKALDDFNLAPIPIFYWPKIFGPGF
jgi:tetratricopeptide (TPR) repeat protein